MKKFTILLLGLVLSISTLTAQEITLSWEGEPIEETIYVFGSQFDAEIVFHAVVTNNTSESMKVRVHREQIELVDGALSQFCWGLCYPPNTNDSPATWDYDLGAGESTSDEYFSGHYLPQTMWGASTVEYTFYNVGNEDQNAKVTVVYSATLAGIGDQEEASINMYPNPATDQVTLESNSRINQVSIFDLTGKEVFSTPANDNKVVVDINSLENGIYLVRLETEQGTRVEKLNKR